MQYAPSPDLPASPPGGVTAGLDWATDDHVVAIVDTAGQVVARFTVPHTAAGLGELVRRLAQAGATEVAIERGDGPVIDILLEAGVTVVVISPNQLKNLRSRYGSAGNKDDRFDAYVLADTLRTDRARLRPLQPDSPATLTLRATVRARRDLVAHRVAVANQLRAHLQKVFPGAVGLFAKLDSPISLTFLTRFDSQDRADWLSPKRLAAWLSGAGYSGRTDPTILFGHLTGAPRGVTGQQGAALAHTTRAHLAVLRSLVDQIKTLAEQISEQLARSRQDLPPAGGTPTLEVSRKTSYLAARTTGPAVVVDVRPRIWWRYFGGPIVQILCIVYIVAFFFQINPKDRAPMGVIVTSAIAALLCGFLLWKMADVEGSHAFQFDPSGKRVVHHRYLFGWERTPVVYETEFAPVFVRTRTGWVETYSLVLAPGKAPAIELIDGLEEEDAVLASWLRARLP